MCIARRTLYGVAAVIALASLGCADSGSKHSAIPEAKRGDSEIEGRAALEHGDAVDTATQQLRHLAGPSLDDWQPVFAAATDSADTDTPHLAVVTALEVPLYSRPGARHAIGLARIGNRLPAEPTSGSGCSDGQWYRVSGGGYLCSADGATIVEPAFTGQVLDEIGLSRRPFVTRPAPFHYAKAGEGGPPRLERLPSASELEALSQGQDPGDIVERWMKGAYLLALARKVEAHGEVFYETVAGQFVRERDLEPKPTPPMHGVRLDGERALPLAFAFRDTDLYCVQDEAAKPCGTVDQHARFAPQGRLERDDTELVLAGEGIAVPRQDLRIVEPIDRPSGIDTDERWVHINLTEQALVAYEGDTPVYVTLVSTGRSGFETPTGLFEVQRKYLSKTMRGKDEDGPYEVQEVPWTLYYDGNYAVHGAYWHERFGRTRSHGCTNVPPADARWLYHWAAPTLPQGWYAMFHERGTHVYIDGVTPPDDDEDGETSDT